MRRAITTVLGAVLAALLSAAPAFADTTVVIHGVDFPTGPAAQLSFVGCQDPYQRTEESLQPYIGIGPGRAPAGRRSLGYDLAGGNAIGSLHYVASMAETTVAGMSVHAPDGASGVAYAGYQEPADRGTGLVWFGRAALSEPAGGWRTVDATRLTYAWTKYDMTTQQQVGDPVGRASVPDFMAAHGGDGPGLYVIGFGCDGRAFNMDAWRIGRPGQVTTYDLEGLVTTTTISGSDDSITAGDSVTLHGTVVDGTGAPMDDARLVLEVRRAGEWVLVAGVDGPEASLSVSPTATATYRWHFVDRPLAEGSVSEPFTVHVTAPGTPPPSPPAPSSPPDPSNPPGPSSPPAPSTAPTRSTTASPSTAPTRSTTASPSTAPTRSTTASPSAAPTRSPRATASPSSPASATASLSATGTASPRR